MGRILDMNIRYRIYRWFMRMAHRQNWHHVKVLYLEGGDVQYWCQWCGLRETRKRVHFMGMKIHTDSRIPPNTVLMVNPREWSTKLND